MKSIRNKLILFIMGCIFAVIFTFTAVTYFFAGEIFKEEAENSYQLKMTSYSKDFNKLINTVEQALDISAIQAGYAIGSTEELSQDTTKLTSFNGLMKNLLLKTAEDIDAVVSVYMQYCPELPFSYTGVAYAKNPGDESFSTIELTDITRYNKKDNEYVGWYYAPIEKKEGVWLNPYTKKNLDDRYVISYCVPILEGGEPIGVIGMDVDMSYITDKVSAIKTGETGYAYLYDSENRIISGGVLHPESVTPGATDENIIEKWEVSNGYFEGEVLSVRDSDNVVRRIYEQSLCDSLTLAVTLPESEMYASRLKLTAYLISAGGGLVCFTSIITLIFTYILVKPIKNLISVSQKISAGDFDVEIKCSSKDEIGVLTARYNETVMMLKKYIDKINKQAFTDAATEVGNKSAYHEAIRKIETLLKYEDTLFSVAVMDVNYLKRYNDKYGHEFGDMLLSDAASIIRKVFEQYEIYRIGGDEFAAIMMSCDEAQCENLIKEFKAEQELFNRNAKQYELGVVIAIGCATYNKQDDAAYIDVFNRADKRMYTDKQEIKKNVVLTDFTDDNR